MDGYAIRAADTAGATEDEPVRLDVVGEVRAGQRARGRGAARRRRPDRDRRAASRRAPMPSFRSS